MGILAIRALTNVSIELAGSDPTAGFTEIAVRELGPERIIYGSDSAGHSFASQLAKVGGAEVDRERLAGIGAQADSHRQRSATVDL